MFIGPPAATTYRYYLADLGLNVHLSPRETIDPYIGAEVSGGVCSIPGAPAGASCSVTRALARLGFRLNVGETFYLWTHVEGQSVSFRVSDPRSNVNSRVFSNAAVLLGLGVNM